MMLFLPCKLQIHFVKRAFASRPEQRRRELHDSGHRRPEVYLVRRFDLPKLDPAVTESRSAMLFSRLSLIQPFTALLMPRSVSSCISGGSSGGACGSGCESRFMIFIFR